MKTTAIKFVRVHTEDSCNLLAIYKGDETHYIDTDTIESFEAIKDEKQR